MAFELAARVSALGDAVLTRFVHVNAQSYCLYTARTALDQRQFYYKQISTSPSYLDQPIPGTEVLIIGPIPRVDSFYVISTGSGNVLFLYDDGVFVWKFIYNFSTDTLVQQPTKLYQGTKPVLASSIFNVFSLYLRNSDVKIRANNGEESTVVSPSAKEVVSFAGVALNDYILEYAGSHRPASDISTTLRPDASTLVLYVLENPAPSSPVYSGTLTDLSGNSRNGSFTSSRLYPNYNGLNFAIEGLTVTCGTFPFSSAITTETWVTLSDRSRLVTLYSGPVSLTITDNRYWTFSFSGASYRATYPTEPGRHNVTVSHTFGAGANTFIAVDGVRLSGSWIAGTGNESPALSGALSISLGEADCLQQFKVSSTAKSLVSIRSYVSGLS